MLAAVASKKKNTQVDQLWQTTLPSPSPPSSTGDHHAPTTATRAAINYFLGSATYWSVVASLSFLCTGLLRAFTSPALLSIQNEAPSKSNLILSSKLFSSSKDAISWIASTAPLASFLGTILSGPLLQYGGRKKTLLLLALICTLGWLLVGNAKSITILLVGRALTGLASGLSTATTPLYISEVVASTNTCPGGTSDESDRRGLLPGVMLATGILLGFILAHQIQVWRTLALAISVFPAALACLCCTIPESPFFISQLSSSQEKAKFDLEMEEVVPSPKSRPSTGSSTEKTGLIPKAKYSVNLSVYVQVGLLMLFQQWSGGNVLIYYLSEILAKNPGSSSSTTAAASQEESRIHQASLLIAVIQFLGFFLALPLINHARVGRKCLLIVSAVLMTLCHLFLGFHFHRIMNSSLQNHQPAAGSYFYEDFVIRVSSLAALLSCYSIGLGPIPYLYIENQQDSLGNWSSSGYLSSFASLVNHLALFVAVKGFPYLFHMDQQQTIHTITTTAPASTTTTNNPFSAETQFISLLHGPDVTFWLFAAVCWLTALFTLHSIPKDSSHSSNMIKGET